jgi:hypothetical protein
MYFILNVDDDEKKIKKFCALCLKYIFQRISEKFFKKVVWGYDLYFFARYRSADNYILDDEIYAKLPGNHRHPETDIIRSKWVNGCK